MSLEIFQSIIDQADREAQDFVNDLKRRVSSIEKSLPEDFESKEYERGINQIKFLQKTIEIIITQQNLSVQLTTAIARNELWTIDKETELAQTKLDLIRMKQNNAFLLRMCGKIKPL